MGVPSERGPHVPFSRGLEPLLVGLSPRGACGQGGGHPVMQEAHGVVTAQGRQEGKGNPARGTHIPHPGRRVSRGALQHCRLLWRAEGTPSSEEGCGRDCQRRDREPGRCGQSRTGEATGPCRGTLRASRALPGAEKRLLVKSQHRQRGTESGGACVLSVVLSVVDERGGAGRQAPHKAQTGAGNGLVAETASPPQRPAIMFAERSHADMGTCGQTQGHTTTHRHPLTHSVPKV